jgi:hypothetical protein
MIRKKRIFKISLDAFRAIKENIQVLAIKQKIVKTESTDVASFQSCEA